jgi:serine/threonine protein kinase
MLGMGKHGEVKKATHLVTGREVSQPSHAAWALQPWQGRQRHCLATPPPRRPPRTNDLLQVAIKFIPREDCPDDAAAWSEVAALKKLRHPHVVRLYDVIYTEDTVMLVLECLNGGTSCNPLACYSDACLYTLRICMRDPGELFDYLVSRRRLSESEAQRFVRQILSALDFCHSKGVVHRDLKLENLLLGRYINPPPSPCNGGVVGGTGLRVGRRPWRSPSSVAFRKQR